MAAKSILAILIGATSLSGCMAANQLPTERLASATLTLSNGAPAGTAQLVAAGQQLSLAVAITGISEGAHGLHLHTTGSCVRPDFTSAGGHLNPTNKDHGKLSPNGSHVGDMPNLEVGNSRTASATIDLAGERSEIMAWLFDADGIAVVVHAGADDYRTDPSGDAGSRIACGVLKKL
ncbi:superoxide dismutase family protein [Altererythrobacter confluentis]|uniref:Superoxide dismutase family protein n=1 Tax=Allopontixanthobacter confluentis TaxID=1849021 RepID=A0A6L7GGL2_9SPHN|nr:superoxide dismutase family protein [Allopontixanthobacter confluentis]MXP15047.1 superoxide dismutase family protein [Allopontixanthobacter confluentis]